MYHVKTALTLRLMMSPQTATHVMTNNGRHDKKLRMRYESIVLLRKSIKKMIGRSTSVLSLIKA
jgi:hypothetical protein